VADLIAGQSVVELDGLRSDRFHLSRNPLP
jgi:hypothetical protein